MAFLRKLTDEQVAEIVERRSTGESYAKIAADFDVSASRIYELTHPEKQAEKAEKLKAKNAVKRAEKKAQQTDESQNDGEDLSDLDLSNVDEQVEAEFGMSEDEEVEIA